MKSALTEQNSEWSGMAYKDLHKLLIIDIKAWIEA